MIRLIEQEQVDDPSNDQGFLEKVSEIFEEGGWLEKALGFEYRKEQAQMAQRYAKSLTEGKHLLFEAGTGVGKSLAYLIPSILFARFARRTCLVATNTINLQEQLLEKDVLSVRELFNRVPGLETIADFKCALLVGRANYLCQNRLSRALMGQGDLFESYQRNEVQRIAEWVESGAVEGIRQEMSPPPNPLVWDLVNADSSVCSAKSCSPENCYYRRARALVEQADLIVVNHSLFFSLLGAGMGPSDDESGILFADDFLIFDEAHEIADVASDHLGVSLSSWSLETFLRQLYNPKKGKGLISKIGRESDLLAIENAALAASDFFQYLHMDTLGEKDRQRLRHSHSLPMEIFPPLSRVLRSLIELSDLASEESARMELRDQAKRIQAYLSDLSEVIEQKDENSVYWLERGGRSNQIIYLRSAPLEIATVLREELFAKDSSILLTSATITRKGSAEFFRNKIGAEKATECVVRSPFNYEKQISISIFKDCPEPQARDRSSYLKYLARSIHALARNLEGGTLVLFTNYSDLRFCHNELKPMWQKMQRSIYAQGDQYSRSEIRKRVIEEGDALLLGAESFWKGFDAKGSCISQVILTRLPFENPSHPLLEAKSEILHSEKRSSFHEITLPAAVIRFRQGIGRLIRSSTDFGDLVILDSRILKKNYGRDFISELPTNEYEVTCLLDLLGDEGLS